MKNCAKRNWPSFLFDTYVLSKRFKAVYIFFMLGWHFSSKLESSNNQNTTTRFKVITECISNMDALLQVLTRDSVTVSVDAVVYYRVSNATVSVANVENAHHSTRLLAQTTLRNILGTKSLHEILSDRDSISGSMQSVLDEATTAWGIKVERVEMWVTISVVFHWPQ